MPRRAAKKRHPSLAATLGGAAVVACGLYVARTVPPSEAQKNEGNNDVLLQPRVQPMLIARLQAPPLMQPPRGIIIEEPVSHAHLNDSTIPAVQTKARFCTHIIRAINDELTRLSLNEDVDAVQTSIEFWRNIMDMMYAFQKSDSQTIPNLFDVRNWYEDPERFAHEIRQCIQNNSTTLQLKYRSNMESMAGAGGSFCVIC